MQYRYFVNSNTHFKTGTLIRDFTLYPFVFKHLRFMSELEPLAEVLAEADVSLSLIHCPKQFLSVIGY